MKLTILLTPQHHERFVFQLDRHQELPVSSNFSDLTYVYYQWDPLATQTEEIAR